MPYAYSVHGSHTVVQTTRIIHKRTYEAPDATGDIGYGQADASLIVETVVVIQ